MKDLVGSDLSLGDNYWFKEGDLSNPITPFTLNKIEE